MKKELVPLDKILSLYVDYVASLIDSARVAKTETAKQYLLGQVHGISLLLGDIDKFAVDRG
jgi:hypothetical protein